MPSYRLSVDAATDVDAIGDYGIATFGLAQALKYHLALESRFELLGQFPRIGIPTYDLRPGLYRYPYGSHTIFYTIGPDHVFIVRILYAGADFKRHF
jgi:toxin ParE1/3/4